MVERAHGGRTVPQIFIGKTHVGGCDELYELEEAGKLDPLLAQGRRRMTTQAPRFRVGLVQMRSGRMPARNVDAAVEADQRGQDRPARTTC